MKSYLAQIIILFNEIIFFLKNLYKKEWEKINQ